MTEAIDDREIIEAINRIARDQPLPGDGQKLFLALQIERMRITEPTEFGALQWREGRRSLARELMDMLSAGIEAAGDRRSRIVLFKRSERRRVERPFGAKRRGSGSSAGEPGGEG